MTQGYYENMTFDQGIATDVTQSNDDLGILYADINTGQMPSYHRLDASLKKQIKFSKNSLLEVIFSITNIYDRANIFYYDQLTLTQELINCQLCQVWAQTGSFKNYSKHFLG